MSRTVERHRLWLIPVCTLIAGVILLCGWQQLHAQAPPTDPAAAGAAPAAAPAAEPQMAISAVIPAGAKTINIKNWDGKVTSMIGFKYKTLDDRVIRVQLPALYRTQQMTRAAWDTLFQCYGMDVEAELAAKEPKIPEMAADLVKKTIEQIQQQMPRVTDEGEAESGSSNPAAGAFDFAKSSMPAVSNGMALPPLLF